MEDLVKCPTVVHHTSAAELPLQGSFARRTESLDGFALSDDSTPLRREVSGSGHLLG